MQYYQDIPRIHTAIAEWGACMVYLYLVKREKFKRSVFLLCSLAVLAVVYGGCFWLTIRLERTTLNEDYLKQLTVREMVAAGGIAVLFAYQSRICDYLAERELAAMNAVLKSQYEQYRNYQDSLDLIRVKYHDLKHQIAGLRMETDEEKRRKWLDAMEEEVSAFENLNKTGNQVLDTILAAKVFHCRKNRIQITCVADGKLLDFMHVTDICSIFGNALDNAIEHVVMIAEEEKRLIHVSVSAKRNFVFVRFWWEPA